MFKTKFKRQEIVEEPEPLEEEVEGVPEYEYDEPAPKLPTPKKLIAPPQRLPQQPLQKEMITKEESTIEEPIWSVQEYPTQTQPIIYNQKTKQAVSIHEALVLILNRLEEYQEK